MVLEFQPRIHALATFDIDSIQYLQTHTKTQHKKKKNKGNISSIWTSRAAPKCASIAIAYKQMTGKDAESHYLSIVGALTEINEYVDVLQEHPNQVILREEFGDGLDFDAVSERITASKHDRCSV